MRENLVPIDLGLTEAFKNAFEESAKTDSRELKVGHSELGIIPVEFIFYSQTKEISPFFAKYWRYQKRLQRGRGFPDIDLDFYQFLGKYPDYGQINCGRGLLNMMFNSREIGFYRTNEGTLLTYMLLDKK